MNNVRLIGISGKKGSGKDTVAKIIQYVTRLPQNVVLEPISYEEFMGYRLNNSPWQTRAFAGKLKDSAAAWIGCTRKQLEDREFKETPLGEGWVKYFVTFNEEKTINRTDWSSSTKIESARIYDYLEVPLTTEALAVEAAKALEEVHGCTETMIHKQSLSPRDIMQLLGTEVGRSIHPNIWVNAMFANWSDQDHWILTDVRFPNEAEAIKSRGGVVIRVNRQDLLRLGHIDIDEHPSEVALDNYSDFDYIIDNNGDMEQLIKRVDQVLGNIKL